MQGLIRVDCQEQLFKKLDRDGNGHLTLSEFKNRNGIKGQ